MKLLSYQKLSTFLVLAAAVVFSACAVSPGPRSQAPTPAEPEVSQSLPKNSPPAAAKAAEPAKVEKQSAPPETIAPPPSKDYAALVPEGDKNPRGLLGLKPDRLIELLGPPGFRRADAPAEIWQYRIGNCVLNLILYETGKSQTLNVAHYAIRSISKKTVSERKCLLGLLIDRQKKLDGATG